jgi:glyoxylase-like metal-dependent hydrolase (beta-lactamase superfamily II)
MPMNASNSNINSGPILFRQLFESDSSTFTYLIADPAAGEAILIDPVLETVERDLQVLKDMGLKLTATLETHVHADHLTGARRLQSQTQCKIAYPAMVQASCSDIGIREGEAFRVGSIELNPLFTPGHTDHHHAYLLDTPVQKMIFTGDALLIEACGRTDFQSGNAETLYNSIHNKIFSLPDETLVYPGHDYESRFVTTVAQEKARNPRLGGGKSKQEFVEIMENLDLPYPRKIDFAVPGNEQCGRCPDNIPEGLEGICAMHDQG